MIHVDAIASVTTALVALHADLKSCNEKHVKFQDYNETTKPYIDSFLNNIRKNNDIHTRNDINQIMIYCITSNSHLFSADFPAKWIGGMLSDMNSYMDITAHIF